jgi:hypothetical protein
VREREDASRTREAGNRDEVEGVAANLLGFSCKGRVGFIAWLGGCLTHTITEAKLPTEAAL